MREPKIQKLKGGNTSSAQLFITGWIKEVRVVIRDHTLTDQEGVQLIREFTESKARQQVDFYLDMNPNPTHRRSFGPFNIRIFFRGGRVQHKK